MVAWTGSDDMAVPSDLTDAELLRHFEPVIRFNEGEYFLPASVESFVARAELATAAVFLVVNLRELRRT